MMPLHVCNGLVGIRVHVGLGHQANGTSAAHVKFNCVCEQLISLCNSERIIKIGQYLRKLCSNEKASSFFSDSQCTQWAIKMLHLCFNDNSGRNLSLLKIFISFKKLKIY